MNHKLLLKFPLWKKGIHNVLKYEPLVNFLNWLWVGRLGKFIKQVRLVSFLDSLLGNHHLLELLGSFYSFVIFFIKHYYKYRTGRQKIVTQTSVERTIVKRKKRQVLEKLPDGWKIFWSWQIQFGLVVSLQTLPPSSTTMRECHRMP